MCSGAGDARPARTRRARGRRARRCPARWRSSSAVGGVDLADLGLGLRRAARGSWPCRKAYLLGRDCATRPNRPIRPTIKPRPAGGDDLRQHLADRAAQDRVGDRRPSAVGSALTMTTRAPLRLAIGTTSATGYTVERRADGEQRGRHSSARPVGPVDVVGHEDLPERDRGRLEDAAARAAGRIVLAGRAPGRAPAPSARARRSSCTSTSRMVPCTSIDRGRVGARLLVQPVDVLGDHRVQLAAALELDDRPVAGVGLRRPRRRVRSRLRHACFRTSGSAM